MGGEHDTGSQVKGRSTASSAADAPTGEAASSRREEILAIAAATFARKGFRSATVRDIAEQAGILSGSLYHHFSSKEQMLDEVIRAAIDDDIERDVELAGTDVDPEQSIYELFHRSLLFVHENPDVVAIMDNSRHELAGTEAREIIARRYRNIRAAWTAVIGRLVAAGYFRADLDVELAYRLMIGSVIGASRWYRPGGSRTVEDIARQFASFCVQGFSATGCPQAAAGNAAASNP